MIFLCHHLDEILKNEYLTVKDPQLKNLKERFDHLKVVIHPKAQYDWMNISLQDFMCIYEYVFRLKLMLDFILWLNEYV